MGNKGFSEAPAQVSSHPCNLQWQPSELSGRYKDLPNRVGCMHELLWNSDNEV